MSEPIRNKKLDLPGAPTPQNTPSTHAPISSRAQEPTVASIKEEDVDSAIARSALAQDPRIVSMIQGKLGSLIGRSSGYIESLPPPVRRRVAGLKGVQKEHAKLEQQHKAEILELEKKYAAKFAPLYERRAKIVNGLAEPSQEEVDAGMRADEEADKDDAEIKTEDADKSGADGEDMKGIPEFWLSAMKNQLSLAELITDRDEGALKYLTNIRQEYLDRPGFRLVFEFAPNEYFTNKTLTKTYYYLAESGHGGDFIYDAADGDKIDWKPGKDLTVRIESKKQRNKNTKQTRVVKKTIPTASFFNFFSPPAAPNEPDEEASSDIEERLEMDYQLGEDIKEKLIPYAIDWFTGEALQFEEEDDDMAQFEDEDDEDGDDVSDDDRDDEEDDDASDDDDDNSKPKQEAAECKQT